jgi:hypothetical protein
MKQTFAVLGSVTLLVAVAIGAAQSNPSMKTNSALGAWELVSADHNGQPMPASQREVKILSPRHFMFVLYGTDNKKVVGAGTGSWTLNGTSYVEHLDFIDVGDSASLNGTDANFTLVVDGNTMTQTGTIGTVKLREVWKRLD